MVIPTQQTELQPCWASSQKRVNRGLYRPIKILKKNRRIFWKYMDYDTVTKYLRTLFYIE